jgi:hypothetical protein
MSGWRKQQIQDLQDAYYPLHDRMRLPCGGIAYFDEASGISYRCEVCMAVVGSIGQPDWCKDEAQKWDNWKALGGKGWDYFAEVEVDDETL